MSLRLGPANDFGSGSLISPYDYLHRLFVGGLIVALYTLRLTTFSAMLRGSLVYSPNTLIALLVLGAGMWAGSWFRARIDQLTLKSSDRLLRSLGSLARMVTLVVASMVALQQLGVGARPTRRDRISAGKGNHARRLRSAISSTSFAGCLRDEPLTECEEHDRA